MLLSQIEKICGKKPLKNMVKLNFFFWYFETCTVETYTVIVFPDGFYCREKSVSSNLCLSPHDTIIRDVLTRFYNCPIVNSRERSYVMSSLTENESHCNILPANLVVETNTLFYILQVLFLIFLVFY